MSASTSDRWRLACHGLLRPSPWYRPAPDDGDASAAVIEHERERKRQTRLDEILGPLDGSAQDIVHACMRDAHDAHVPDHLATEALTPARIRMVHPLSGETTGTMDETAWERWFDVEDERLGWLETKQRAGGDISDKIYRELWRDVMMTKGPRAPGSLWLADHDIAAHRSLTAALLLARIDGGEPALLTLHLGPVQGFIASARRTHDLWIGSYTVAYLSVRAAVAIAEHSGPQAVVMPALAHVPAAQPLLFPDKPPVDSAQRRNELFETLRERLRSSLSNKIVAVVSLAQARAAAQQATTASHTAWMDMAGAMKKQLAEAAHGIPAYDKDPGGGWKGFEEQLDAHLEIDAVIQPWPQDLTEMRARLERLDLKPHDALAPEHDGKHSRGAAYGALYDLNHRMLAGHRKAQPQVWPEGDPRPKCSQCGQREQMGPVEGSPQARRHALAALSEKLAGDTQRESQRESLQFTRGEGLCAVCQTKRFAPELFYATERAGLGLDSERLTREERRRLRAFPSTYSIASSPFRLRLMQALDGSRVRDRAAFQRVAERWARAVNHVLAKECLDFTPPGNLLPGLSRGEVPSPAEMLTLDGQWLYESSYQPETAWLDHYPERAGENNPNWTELANRLPEAFEAYREMRKQIEAGPSSYFAVLQLDGDQMGKWLTGQHPNMPRVDELVADKAAKAVPRPLYPALHGDLSRRLAQLAIELHDLVENIYLGRVVYSGGDDLLAFLPVQTALPCLRAIERMVRSKTYLGHRVTVSAGMAIAHVRAPLSRALQAARGAEEDAKEAGGKGTDRHAHFAVHVLERSGAPLKVTLPWRVAGSETIDMLWKLLEPGFSQTSATRGGSAPVRDDASPLLRVAVARQLEAELGELGCGSRDAEPDERLKTLFRHRVDTLLGLSKLPAEIRAGFATLLDRLTPREMVGLVLLLRFLAREDRGVDAHELCRQQEARDV
jgi:CRISPR-associated protein Cmr2